MATILDAHPDVAMGYEMYQHLLAPPEGRVSYASELLRELQMGGKRVLPAKDTPHRDFAVFSARANRSGVAGQQLVALLEQHVDEGRDFADIGDRMMFVKRVVETKGRAEGKSIWGTKISSNYAELSRIFPDSRFLFMLRDGRDVAASRKMVGQFNQSMAQVAEGWTKQIVKFERFAARACERAILVPYEKLACNPEAEMRHLMEKLGLTWSDRLLAFHALNLSIHRSPTGHLSGQQVKTPIGTRSIGRWKKDLTADEVREFEAQAGETLARLGYL